MIMINDSKDKIDFKQNNVLLDLTNIDLEFIDTKGNIVVYSYDKESIRLFVNNKYIGRVSHIILKNGTIIDDYDEHKFNENVDQYDVYDKVMMYQEAGLITADDNIINLDWIDEKYAYKYQKKKIEEQKKSSNQLINIIIIF